MLPAEQKDDLTPDSYKTVISNLASLEPVSKEMLKSAKKSQENHSSQVAYRILSDMYSTLMLAGDRVFSLQAAQFLYKYLQLEASSFVNWLASLYFARNLHLLFLESLESRYIGLRTCTEFVKARGSLEKVGTKNQLDVLIMTLTEPEYRLRTVFKSKFCPPSFCKKKINEQDYCLLVIDLTEQGVTDTTAKLVTNNLNELSQDRHFASNFGFKKNCNVVVLACLVCELSKENKVKLIVMGSTGLNSLLTKCDLKWTLAKGFSGPQVEYTKNSKSLVDFCTTVSMNPTVQQIILSPLACNSKALDDLCKTKGSLLNPSVHNKLLDILESSSKKNYGTHLEAVKSALVSTLTVIHSPPGAPSLATQLDIVSHWRLYSQLPILVLSSNKDNLIALHALLLNAKIPALRIEDEPSELPQLPSSGTNRASLETDDRPTVMSINRLLSVGCKGVSESFKIVLCEHGQSIEEALKSTEGVTCRVLVCEGHRRRST